MQSAGQVCQSCGVSLSSNNQGTEKTGAKSTNYCGECYQNGAYTDPKINVQHMQEKVRLQMASTGASNEAINARVMGILKLKRWGYPMPTWMRKAEDK